MKHANWEVPENLRDYRNPTEEEKEKIYRYMRPELQQRRKLMKIFRSFFVCFAAALTAGTLGKVMEPTMNPGELIAEVLIAIAFWGGFVAIHKSLLTNRKLETHVRMGDYKVLDCIPHEHFYNLEPGRKDGSVQIQTKDGIVCMGHFPIDMETALLCEKGEGKNMSLLLMYEKETGECEVFSERMLNRGSM